MNVNWRGIAKGLGIAGAIGGLCAAGSTAIKIFKPEASELPSEHANEIKRLVGEAMKEAADKKDQS